MCTLRVVAMISLSIVKMRVVTIDVTQRRFTLFSFVSGVITPKRINLLAVTSSRKLWMSHNTSAERLRDHRKICHNSHKLNSTFVSPIFVEKLSF